MNFHDGHLTDEQFAGLLMGTTDAAVRDHLRACGQCSVEAERVAAAIGSFERQSRLWAERQVASGPGLSAAQRSSFAWAGIFARPQAWAAVALAVAAGLGLGVAISAHREPPQQAIVARQPVTSPANAQSAPSSLQTAAVNPPPMEGNARSASVASSKLKADNELLSAIDGELRADAAPVNLYGLSASERMAN